jgi:SM-20-related protein
MTLIDLDAIDAAPLQTDPFDFLVVPGCIGPQALDRINADYPAIQRPGNLSLEDIQFGGAFEKFLDEFEGPEFAARIGAKFGVDLSGSPTTVTVRKFCEKSDGNIHTDHPSKIITVLAYFNTDWERAEGQLRMLRSSSDIEDYAAEVPPLGGTVLAFRRTDHSYHGHKPFVGERRMVQMNYLKSGRLARFKQQVDRMGTRTMKKALRLINTGG